MKDYQPEIYIIPVNVADNGNVLNGNIKKKNMLEAVTILGIGLFLSVIILGFLSMIIKIVIFLPFFLLSMIALVGIKGESMIEYVLEYSFFKKKQRNMKYKLPRKPEMQKKRRF